MSDRGDCRTAPAKPGLLIRHEQESWYITDKVHTEIAKPFAYLQGSYRVHTTTQKRKETCVVYIRSLWLLIGTSSGYAQIQRGLRYEQHGHYT